jgi:hypothetical protein
VGEIDFDITANYSFSEGFDKVIRLMFLSIDLGMVGKSNDCFF